METACWGQTNVPISASSELGTTKAVQLVCVLTWGKQNTLRLLRVLNWHSVGCRERFRQLLKEEAKVKLAEEKKREFERRVETKRSKKVEEEEGISWHNGKCCCRRKKRDGGWGTGCGQPQGKRQLPGETGSRYCRALWMSGQRADSGSWQEVV